MKELPVRKPVRLKGYDYSSAGCYFVTFCVQDGHELLGEIVGDDAHIVPLKLAYSEYGATTDQFIKSIDTRYADVFVDKYVIMPNHVHMILVLKNTSETMKKEDGTMWASSPTKTSVSSVVRSLKILTAKKCGFSFWQRSFYDHIIRDEAEYQRIWSYIDQNPANWKKDRYYKQRGIPCQKKS